MERRTAPRKSACQVDRRGSDSSLLSSSVLRPCRHLGKEIEELELTEIQGPEVEMKFRRFRKFEEISLSCMSIWHSYY